MPDRTCCIVEGGRLKDPARPCRDTKNRQCQSPCQELTVQVPSWSINVSCRKILQGSCHPYSQVERLGELEIYSSLAAYCWKQSLLWKKGKGLLDHLRSTFAHD